MYCSTCGVAVAPGLSYCNYCGAKLSGGGDGPTSSEVKPGLLVSAMAGVFILGIGAITLLIGMMRVVLQLPAERVLALALLPFLILLLLEGVFLRLLFRANRRTDEAAGTAGSKRQGTNQLDAAQARALPEGVPSVTEHTTRAFAPINREPTSK